MHRTILSFAMALSLSAYPLATGTAPAHGAAFTVYKHYIAYTLLKNYDVVLIIDKSRSMSKMDCPKSGSSQELVSRWEWCKDHLIDLCNETQVDIPHKLRLVLFSSSAETCDEFNIENIQAEFAENLPKGATHATATLSDQLNEYFERRNRNDCPTKPLLIAMITDGCTDNPMSLVHTIEDATQKMDRPNEIAFTMLQVGYDSDATKLMSSLSRSAVSKRSKFDIVTTRSFDQLQDTGLIPALVNAITIRPALSQVGTNQ